MKYKLTNKTRKVYGVTFHQIKALTNFSNVKAGDLGGWIESEYNLSQEGNCWVFGDAKVFGNAKVYDDAKVFGDAWVFGNAKVYDDAKVFGNAKVSDYARVSGDAEVFGNAKVSDYARIYDNAKVFGNAKVYDDVKISGNRKIGGSDRINENTNKPISKTNSMKRSELKQIIREAIDELNKSVEPITNIDNVISVYSGKPGCMCGCQGTYKYASKYKDISSKNRGYEIKDTEINDQSIKLIVNKINNMLKSGNYKETKRTPQYVFVDTGTRYYAAYFADYIINK